VGPVRKFTASDADLVVDRVEQRLRLDASRNPLVNPLLDRELLRHSLCAAPDPSWVFDRSGAIDGHLYGALLADSSALSVWTGPDGVSFDTSDVLAGLVECATAVWKARGAREHFVWCLSEPSRVEHWTELGYTLFSARGAIRLQERPPRPLPAGYSLRRGRISDFERAVELDAVLDAAQGIDARLMSRIEREKNREELQSTLLDPETHHYVVEHEHHVIAQCVTFPTPPRRGSFNNTLFVSEVVVEPRHQRLGISSAMLDVALDNARTQGFEFAETQWRSSNLGATLHWLSYGFQPTYVRLRRALD